jgi:hypothetical protein
MLGKKFMTTLALAGGLTLVGTGTALAATSGTFSLSDTGVSFSSGYYYFATNTNYDFYYEGNLKDTAVDGNAVFVHGKVAGYGYGPKLYNSGFKSQYLNDPAATWVSSGNVEACNDRGSFLPDYCDAKTFYK